MTVDPQLGGPNSEMACIGCCTKVNQEPDRTLGSESKPNKQDKAGPSIRSSKFERVCGGCIQIDEDRAVEINYGLKPQQNLASTK